MRPYKPASFYLLSFLLILALWSCRQKNAKSDEDITASVTSTTRVIDSNITVTVHRGIVTLHGEVLDEATRTAAINAVKHIEGVKTINANLSVKPGGEKVTERTEEENK